MSNYCIICGGVSNRVTCRACWEIALEQLPYFHPDRRQRAITAGFKKYRDYCDSKGVSYFNADTGLCTCCNLSPAEEKADPLRIYNRKKGHPTFPGECAIHGFGTPCWTGAGKCVRCFRSDGVARPAPLAYASQAGKRGPQPKDSARAAARRSGERTYKAACTTHGPSVDTWVNSGACVGCCHETGKVRAKPLRCDEP